MLPSSDPRDAGGKFPTVQAAQIFVGVQVVKLHTPGGREGDNLGIGAQVEGGDPVRYCGDNSLTRRKGNRGGSRGASEVNTGWRPTELHAALQAEMSSRARKELIFIAFLLTTILQENRGAEAHIS